MCRISTGRSRSRTRFGRGWAWIRVGVQAQVGPPGVACMFKDFTQARWVCPGGGHIDRFVQVPVGGGQGRCGHHGPGSPVSVLSLGSSAVPAKPGDHNGGSRHIGGAGVHRVCDEHPQTRATVSPGTSPVPRQGRHVGPSQGGRGHHRNRLRSCGPHVPSTTHQSRCPETNLNTQNLTLVRKPHWLTLRA